MLLNQWITEEIKDRIKKYLETNDSDTTERLHFHFSLSCIGEGNGNLLSILAWQIAWTEEPSGLQSMGSQRVGHD